MTESDVKEIIRKEMRAFRSTMWNNSAHGNHDAQTALDKVRAALDEHFPESPREYAERLDEHTIERRHAWLNDIGVGLQLSRGSMSDEEYVIALRERRLELLKDES